MKVSVAANLVVVSHTFGISEGKEIELGPCQAGDSLLEGCLDNVTFVGKRKCDRDKMILYRGVGELTRQVVAMVRKEVPTSTNQT